MGLFDDVGKVAGTVLGAGIAGPVGGIIGGSAGGALFGDGNGYQLTPEQQQALEDQRAALAKSKAYTDKLSQQATDYRNNIGDTQSQLYNQARDAGTRGLAEQMAGVDRSSNHRGLLYSGLREGAQATANQRYASDLSKKRVDINQQTENQAQDMEGKAVNAGFQQQKAAQGLADQQYKEALLRKQSQNAMVGQGIGGAAKVAGAMI